MSSPSTPRIDSVTSVVAWPRSVRKPKEFPPERMTKPTGSTASCGMRKDRTETPSRVNSEPLSKIFHPVKSETFSLRTAEVCLLQKIGVACFFDH